MTKVTALVSDKGIDDIVILDAPKSVKKSKLKAVDPKAAEPSKPKILIFGRPGVGKTWTSLDFPSVYYIDTEGGANLDHYTDKLKKSGGVYFGPEQGSQDFQTVIDEVKALATEEHPYKTLVIDSISKIFNTEIANEQDRLSREKKEDAFGASKKPAISATRKLINWIDKIDMNVILIAHEKPLWANGEQVGVTFDAWEKLEYELHLAMQIAKQGDSRMARVKKSRLTGFADSSSFPWSYNDFAERYGREIIETKGHAIELATPEQLAEMELLLEVVKLPDGQQNKWLSTANVERFEDMETKKLASLLTHIKTKLNKGEK